MADPSDPGDGKRARLRLGARIGRGGMAEVFAARLVGAAGFEKDVAVKRVLPKYAGDKLFLERFLHEARLAARLSHPNVVQIFELGDDGADHYLVMEAVRGITLRTALSALADRGEKMPASLSVWIAQQVLAGLSHAHELKSAGGVPLGIVHRDVSPQNVLLGYDGVVKLIDFGIARAAAQSGLTEVGAVVGKAQFMAPEQIRGEPVDARADLFSVGVVMFEMLSGKRPFDGTDAQVFDRVQRGVRDRVASAAPHVDAQVAGVVERALAVTARERWPSAREMGVALRHTGTAAPGGAHDLEALLTRLYPSQSKEVWPVDAERADGAEHTGTMDAPGVGPQTREITLVSQPGRGEAPTRPLEASGPTLDILPPRRRRRRLAIAAVATVALVAVLALLTSRDTTRPQVDAGVVASSPDAGALAQTVTDAGVVEIEEEIAEVIEVDAGPRAQVKRRIVKKQKLVVETRPWSEVRVDGKRVGITPLSAQVTVGAHTLTLTNPEEGLKKTMKIVVTDSAPLVVREDLRR